MSDQQMKFVGDRVISVLMPLVLRTDHVPVVLVELCTTTFAILLGELEYVPEDERSRHLEVVLAIYVSLGDNILGMPGFLHLLTMASASQFQV